jgi:hypothetical protein
MVNGNPALANGKMRRNLSLTYNPSLAGIRQYNTAYCDSFSKAGVLFASIQYLDYGSFSQTDASGMEAGNFSASQYAISVGTSRQKGNYKLGAAFKFSALQINGLQALVADSPATGTVGGINRATYTFWRNISFDSTTDGGAAATTANIQDYMHRVWLQLVRGTDRTDLIVADNNYYRLYWGSLTPNQRFMSPEMATLGFQSLKYQDADVVLDGGYGGGAPTNHMYFLNTDFLHWRPHSERNFELLSPDRFAVNQDAMVKIIAWAGNLTLSNAFLQGILKD